MKVNIKEWDRMMRKRHDEERTKEAIIRFAKRNCYPATPDNAFITELTRRYFDDTLPKEIKAEIDEIRRY